MKILYLVSWYPRPNSENSGVFFRQLAEGIADCDNEVVVACIHVKFVGKIDRIGLDIRKRKKITEYVWFVPVLIPRAKRLYSFLGKRYMTKLIKLIQKKHGTFDVVHVQSAFSAAEYAMPFLMKSGIPVVYTEHSSKLLRGNLSNREISILQQLNKYASARVAVSRYLASRLSQYVSNVQVIGNMLDTYALSQPSGRFTFLCLGTLRKAKGMYLLIRSFVNEFSSEEPVRLLIGGEGEYHNALKALIDEVGAGYDIQLAGAIPHDKITDFYKAGNCFVLPSFYETFGVVYIEAMACGLPVIATRCGGPEELIDETNGILIDVGSEEQLSSALRFMYTDFDKFNPQKISHDTVEKYGKRSICDTYNALYQALLKQRQV